MMNACCSCVCGSTAKDRNALCRVFSAKVSGTIKINAFEINFLWSALRYTDGTQNKNELNLTRV